MKNLTYILLFFINSLQAQFTLIPDSNFEGRLINAGYDDIFDGQVLTENIVNVTVLNLTEEFIYDLTGIQDFIALEEIHARDNFLTSIDLSQNTNLRILNINNNRLTSLNLTGNPNLEEVYCISQAVLDDFFLTNVDVSQCYSLIHLDLSNNAILTDINISNSLNLEYLNVGGANISNLNVTNNTKLEYLNIYGILIESINLNNNIDLLGLDITACLNLNGLDLSNNYNLEDLRIGYFDFTELDLTNNINLKSLIYSNYDENSGLGSLDDNLTELDLTNNVSLDFSNCPNLRVVDMDYMYNISYLNLKNENNETLEVVDVQGYPFTPDTLFCIEVDDPDSANASLPPYTPNHWIHLTGYEFSEDCSTISVDDFAIEDNITIYPNPTTENLIL